MSDGKEEGVLSLILMVQERPDTGQLRTSFADLKFRNKKTSRMYPDATSVQIPMKVIGSDEPDQYPEGKEVTLDLTQGVPFVLEEGGKSEFVSVLTAEKEGIRCITEGGISILIVPTGEKGKLEVSDGDTWEMQLCEWGKKEGSTLLRKITAPSVRGIHLAGGTTNQ